MRIIVIEEHSRNTTDEYSSSDTEEHSVGSQIEDNIRKIKNTTKVQKLC